MSGKDAALKKVDIALCKLQDLYYVDVVLPDNISAQLERCFDSLRTLQTKIEQTEFKKKGRH